MYLSNTLEVLIVINKFLLIVCNITFTGWIIIRNIFAIQLYLHLNKMPIQFNPAIQSILFYFHHKSSKHLRNLFIVKQMELHLYIDTYNFVNRIVIM